MNRLPDWQVRFATLCASRRHTPFQWGVHDCCLWAADAVCAVTGVDFAWEHRGTYHTATGAYRLLHRLGGMQGMVEAALGPSSPTSMGTIGDIVLLAGLGQPDTLGVHNGQTVLAPGPTGIIPAPIEYIQHLWKV